MREIDTDPQLISWTRLRARSRRSKRRASIPLSGNLRMCVLGAITDEGTDQIATVDTLTPSTICTPARKVQHDCMDRAKPNGQGHVIR